MKALAQHGISPVDQRAELNDPAHLNRINPGQDRAVSTRSTGLAPRRQADPGERSWRRQELAQQAIGLGWEEGGRDLWSNFSNGQRSSKRGLGRGSVEIDAGTVQKPGDEANKPGIPQQLSGWDRMAAAHRMAASYEEGQREVAGRLGRSTAPGGRTLMIRV